MIFNFDNQKEIDGLHMHDNVFNGYVYDYENHIVKMMSFDERQNIYRELIFNSVIFVENQCCEFWGPGNSIYAIWAEKDNIKTLLKKHYMAILPNENDSNELEAFSRYIEICIQLNSGDKIKIICESFEMSELTRV